jgi:hypothetical protein
LALLLSARQEFLTAARFCEGAFEQFQDPKNLFGDTNLHSPYRSHHLKLNEKSGPKASGIVDEMDDFEKENVLEVKMTQLTLIEVLEGPDVAVNASDELLSLYARLFGDPQKDACAPKRPSTATKAPPKSSAGTIKSIKGSIFGRSSKSTRKAQTAPALGERSALAARPQTSQTLASSRAPAISVTNENGNTAKEHRHLTKQHPPEKQKRSSSLASGSLRHRTSSASRRTADHSVTTVDGEKFFTPPADTHHRDEWIDDYEHQTALPEKASTDISKPLPHKPQEMPQREKSLKATKSDPSKNQDDRLPQVSPYSSFTNPVTRFPKDQERRRRTATLVKVWLLVSAFYRRAAMYEDARGAISEAYKLVQSLESDVSNDTTGNISISNPGWGGGKSVGELLGDVFAEVSTYPIVDMRF